MNENSRANRRYAATKWLVLLCVAWLTSVVGIRAYGQPVTWTGTGGDDNWSTAENWNPLSPPGSGDIAEFNENDSPGTSALDTDFTIARLQYLANSEHLLDLYGFNLHVDDFVHVGVGNSSNGAAVTWTNSDTHGRLSIGNTGALGTFYVGVNDSAATGETDGNLLLDGLTVEALVNNLSIGRKSSLSGIGTANGTLTLSNEAILSVGTVSESAKINIGMNESTAEHPYGGYGDATGLLDATQGTADFHLSELNVGRRTWGLGDGTATGTLRWSQPDPLYATDVYFARGGYTTGILEVPSGGTFFLGDADDPVSLLGIGYHDTSGGGTATAHLNLRDSVADPTFVAYIGDNLSIGRTISGGSADASLTLGENSHLYVGTTADPAVVNIGMNGSSTGNAVGLLDATQGEVVLHLGQLNVGRHTGSGGIYSGGTATGTLRWDQDVAINADEVYFGRGQSTGVLEVPTDGHFQLGTATDPVSRLAISYHDTGSPGASNAHLDLTVTDPFFTAYIGGALSIGHKASMSGSGTADGSLTLGSHSTLHVGTAGAPAKINIGMNESTSDVGFGGYGDAVGVLDVTDGTPDFHLSELNVGYNKWGSGTATGTLKWNQLTQALYAEEVYFGRGASTGKLEVPAGGTFLLGDGGDPVSRLGISYHDEPGGGTSTAHLNLRDADPTFTAVIGDDLSIGRTTSGSATANGSLILGEHSTLSVGTTLAPAVVNIGMNGTGTTGELDATQGTVEFHLTELNVGRRNSSSGGTPIGTLKWSQAAPIDAERVYFGRGQSTGVLEVPTGGHFQLGTTTDPISRLAISYHDTNNKGASNAHLDLTVTDPFFEAYIGGDLSIGRKAHMGGSGTADGSLTSGSNSILSVGTAVAPAMVNIGMNESLGVVGGTGDGTGVLDARLGTVNFHLSELNVGRTMWGMGTANGTLTTGSGSMITATTVNIGEGTNATGNVNMNGGLFAAGIVNMGAGGTFNFTDGRLGIGTFNTYSGSGSLNQQGGTLAPGFSPFDTSLAGIATINGDYCLTSGTLEIELFGLGAGTEYDQVFVNGLVRLDAGGSLDVVLGFAPEIGDQFIILDNDEDDWINGTFAGLSEGAVFSTSYLSTYYPFRISYVGNDGNDIVLTSIVPVPGASLLAGLGLLTSTWLCRRRTAHRKGN